MTCREMVVYTQRVEVVESYGERRDCGDQNIPAFIRACGFLPVPLPNIPGVALELAERLRPAGIIFTGGNSLAKYGGNAPERDRLERDLLAYALERDIPLYGFCRGRQVIADYFGAELQDVKGHVAIHHKICGLPDVHMVNSYHNQACLETPEGLETLAVCEDGVIEAIRVKGRRVLGAMWHPEREQPFCRADIDRIRTLFGKEGDGICM